MFELKNLNEAQLNAAIQTEGPVIVLAGAGTGKTRVLTNRIANLVENHHVDPYNILAVTFTNKAAREMKERIASLISSDIKKLWALTFHSMCARTLRIELGEFEGLRGDFTIIDDEDRLKIIRDCIKELNYDTKLCKPNAIKQIISNAKNMYSSDLKFESYDYEIASLRKIHPDYYRVIQKYNETLKKENLIDFDDLLLVTLKLFIKRPDILFKYAYRFRYILIDEFQDTNDIQYELVKLLASVHQNIFIVGDQDQSIYSFRGANIRNIDNFMRDFPTYKLFLLEENYRSTNQILKIANNVIAHNKNRVAKVLYTNISDGPLPRYFHAQSAYDETSYIAETISKYAKKGYSYNDFAIMYRSNYISRNMEDILIKYNIPYIIYGGKSFYERKEIKDMVAYLRLIINPNDDFSFKRVVNEPKRKIGDALLSKLGLSAIDNSSSYFKAIDYVGASGVGMNNLIAFKFMILELAEKLNDEEMPFADIIDCIMSKSGYSAMLDSEGDSGIDRRDNIEEFKSVLVEIDEQYSGSRVEKLTNFLYDLSLRTNDDSTDEANDRVKLMTFHQAKGLEYRVVFMMAMEENIFPSSQAIDECNIDEERRICYVGITRAREELFITNAMNRLYAGYTANFNKSRFIDEMGIDNLQVLGQVQRTVMPTYFYSNEDTKKEEKKPELVDMNINVGDKINHKVFGDGIVVSKEENILVVAFSQQYGIKKLMNNHPSIRKITN